MKKKMMMKTKGEELNKWYTQSGYEDIKVFIRPEDCDKTNVELLSGEILDSVKRLERGELEIISADRM